MVKKRSESSAQGGRQKKNAKHMRACRIDFSDIPESTSAELKRARRVGRPTTGCAKQLIAIRIAPSLLADLQSLAKKKRKPYQTLLHELLEAAVRREAA